MGAFHGLIVPSYENYCGLPVHLSHVMLPYQWRIEGGGGGKAPLDPPHKID